MKILESTERRLVIEIEKNTIFRELVYPSLWVSTLVTICFVAISKNLPSLRYGSFILSFAIGWLLFHLLYPEKERDNCYITFLSIPLLGVGVLSLVAMDSLLSTPKIASLTFDKDVNLLIIKKIKILFWYPVTQYPLDEIIEATLDTQFVYTGSTNGIFRPVVQLSRRRQNGKIVQRDILFYTDANQSIVNQINRFLRHT